jgi:Rrf2 family protein
LKPFGRLLWGGVLSRSSEYAVRALTYLALHEPQGYCLSRKVAGDLKIPAPFLGKVLQSLVGRGLLESHRGRAGGFRLARPADEIRLGEIVEAFEEIDNHRCVLGQAECSDGCGCPLHHDWCNVRSQLVERLNSTSLADLVRFSHENTASSFPYQQQKQEQDQERRIANTGMRASFSTE